jgi:hypothetical protein
MAGFFVFRISNFISCKDSNSSATVRASIKSRTNVLGCASLATPCRDRLRALPDELLLRKSGSDQQERRERG